MFDWLLFSKLEGGWEETWGSHQKKGIEMHTRQKEGKEKEGRSINDLILVRKQVQMWSLKLTLLVAARSLIDIC